MGTYLHQFSCKWQGFELGTSFSQISGFLQSRECLRGIFSPAFSGFIEVIIILYDYYYNLIEMEKEAKLIGQSSLVKIHACFEELDTLRFLTFLEHREGKLLYRGVTEEQSRKSKQFCFNSISLLTDKLKHTHNEAIREVVEALLRGENRSILIFGNDESKKEKLLIGQSQNAGLLLLILSEIFNTCYDRELEDKVTIKLSCWQQSEGEISDGFGVNPSLQIEEDHLEGKVLIGNPQVIVRNMKSALKIIKLFMKRAEEAREQKEDATQTLVISVKLEIDSSYDKQGNVTQYKLPKLHFVKFANPYSVKATKHPQWFISLFNYFQSDALEKMRSQEQQSDDGSVNYIKECVIRAAHRIHCFSCFGNKMTANQCLTTLKFSSYLQYAKLNPQNMGIKLPELKKQHLVLESQLLKSEEEKQSWFQGKEFDWLKLEDIQIISEYQEILSLNIKGMELGNILEYQYAIILTSACDKLEKYIFNEEVEDYFYAKKVSPEITSQTRQAVSRYIQCRKRSLELQRKILQRILVATNRLKRESGESRGGKYLLNSKIKEKQIYQKIFLIYNTEVGHFLYEENEELAQKLLKYEKPIVRTIENQAPQISAIELSNFSAQILQKARESQLQAQVPCCVQVVKRRKAVDQLEMMFTNSNANLCGRRLKN